MRMCRAVALPLAAACLVLAPSLEAAPPTHLSLTVDDTFPSRYTQVCGIPVVRHDSGMVRITLFHDNNGTVIGETDTVANYKITLFSPVELGGTGASFTSPVSASLKSTYPDGVYLGAPAILVFNGNQFMPPGLPQAGHDVYAGEIAFIDEAGVPFVDLTGLIDEKGHFTAIPEYYAAICAALGAP